MSDGGIVQKKIKFYIVLAAGLAFVLTLAAMMFQDWIFGSSESEL